MKHLLKISNPSPFELYKCCLPGRTVDRVITYEIAWAMLTYIYVPLQQLPRIKIERIKDYTPRHVVLRNIYICMGASNFKNFKTSNTNQPCARVPLMIQTTLHKSISTLTRPHRLLCGSRIICDLLYKVCGSPLRVLIRLWFCLMIIFKYTFDLLVQQVYRCPRIAREFTCSRLGHVANFCRIRLSPKYAWAYVNVFSIERLHPRYKNLGACIYVQDNGGCSRSSSHLLTTFACQTMSSSTPLLVGGKVIGTWNPPLDPKPVLVTNWVW